MQTPLRITFRHTSHSKALEKRVEELVSRLERFHRRITGCHVVIEGPQVHPENGGVFSVHMEVIVPGGTINAVSSPKQYEDAYAAAADAFESIKRRLTSFAAKH